MLFYGSGKVKIGLIELQVVRESRTKTYTPSIGVSSVGATADRLHAPGHLPATSPPACTSTPAGGLPGCFPWQESPTAGQIISEFLNYLCQCSLLLVLIVMNWFNQSDLDLRNKRVRLIFLV